MKALKFFMGLTVMTLFFTACDSLDELTKSPLERSIDQVVQEWTVDTIRYVRYNLDSSVYSDVSEPKGKLKVNHSLAPIKLGVGIF